MPTPADPRPLRTAREALEAALARLSKRLLRDCRSHLLAAPVAQGDKR
jgi:hypothetical protein